MYYRYVLVSDLRDDIYTEFFPTHEDAVAQMETEMKEDGFIDFTILDVMPTNAKEYEDPECVYGWTEFGGYVDTGDNMLRWQIVQIPEGRRGHA